MQTVPENDHNEVLFRQGYCETAEEVGISNEWTACLGVTGTGTGPHYSSWLRTLLQAPTPELPANMLQVCSTPQHCPCTFNVLHVLHVGAHIADTSV
jgi:hypothetical protein